MLTRMVFLLCCCSVAQGKLKLSDEHLAQRMTDSMPAKAIVEKLTTIKELNQQALSKALDYYAKNKIKHKLANDYIAIADFSQTSDKKRLAIIDLKKGTADFYKVAHGQGSDPNHDLKFDKFSGKPGSWATPEGFHRMDRTYYGKHGLSRKMQGLEEGNKTSMKRAIVLHGAKYVSWAHTGRSKGCPSVENKYSKKIINQLKDGSLFYHHFK